MNKLFLAALLLTGCYVPDCPDPTPVPCELAGMEWTQPQYGATNVPINVEIRVAYLGETPPNQWYLQNSQGSLMALSKEITGIGYSMLVTLRPESILKDFELYYLLGDQIPVLRFTTTGGADRVAPALESVSADTICNVPTVGLTYNGATDDIADPEQLAYKVFFTTDGSFPTEESEQLIVSRDQDLWGLDGNTYCRYNSDIEIGDPLLIRAQLVDMAGNVSEMTDPATIVVGELYPTFMESK